MPYRILDERDLKTLNGNFSNALKGKLKGEIVRADDVSTAEHELGLKVHGKNLFRFTQEFTGTSQGISVSIQPNTSVIMTNGTATNAQAFSISKSTIELEAGTYTASIFGANDVATSYDRLYIDDMTNGGVIVNYIKTGQPKTFTLAAKTEISVCIIFGAGSSYDNVAIGVQIEEGETATEYTPWLDTSTVKVKRCGKNLVKFPYSDGEVTRAGVTYTVKENGEIVANGTSSGSYFNVVTTASKQLYLKKGVTYHLSGVSKKTGLYYAYAKDSAGVNFFDYGEGASFIPTESGYGAVTIVVTEGSEISNIAFKPQIEIGNTTTDYEKYTGEDFNPSSDGIIEGVTSLSPTMTLFTDTEGVKVECEYTKDTNVVIEKLVNAVIALGGSV